MKFVFKQLSKNEILKAEMLKNHVLSSIQTLQNESRVLKCHKKIMSTPPQTLTTTTNATVTYAENSININFSQVSACVHVCAHAYAAAIFGCDAGKCAAHWRLADERQWRRGVTIWVERWP